MTWSTYMFIARDCTVLYVGMTGRGFRRVGSHFTQPWWPQVEEIQIEHHDTEWDARRRETELIKTFRPLHNISQRPTGDPGLCGHSRFMLDEYLALLWSVA